MIHTPAVQILSFGEALIDFKETTPHHFESFEGGSPMNVAIAAARLGIATGFAGQISHDMFGQRLHHYLRENQVHTDWLHHHPAPSTLAFVAERDGDVHFSFLNHHAADTLYDPQPRPSLPESLRAIFFGSVSLLKEPTASSITDIVRQQRDRSVIFFDPNVRPTLISDKAAYLRNLVDWLRLSHISKVSTQDLAWLYPEKQPEEIAEAWLAYGMAAVIITRGADGVSLYRREAAPLHVAAPQVSLADTVGAGDTFSGSFLAELVAKGYDQDIHTLSHDIWGGLLEFASTAAALNCTRHGAQPPTRDELLHYLQDAK